MFSRPWETGFIVSTTPGEHLKKEGFIMVVQTQKNILTEMPMDNGSDRVAVPVERRTLIDELNHDLASEYQSMLMYLQFSAKLTGPYRQELRRLFQKEIGDEQKHAQLLADKICALGGEPTTAPLPVAHVDQPCQMLEAVLEVEKRAIADYQMRIRQAEVFGDIGLRVDLENQVADETRHKEEVERILAGWSQP